MPLYPFKCSVCQREDEVFCLPSELDADIPSCCNGDMDYNWAGLRRRHVPFKAFSTTHVLGPQKAPLEIDSMHTLRRVERDYNVNFPAYGDTMLDHDAGLGRPSHWIDEHGVTHRD